MKTKTDTIISKYNLYLIGLYNRLQGRYRMGKTVLLKKHRAIYFPIPKVACTSILKVCANLLNFKMHPELSVHDMYFPAIQDLSKIDNYNDYFKFAFVRNPWDRLVSCYSNKIRADSNFNNQWFQNGVSRGLLKYNLFRAGMSFEEFANIVIDIPDDKAEKHFKSQYTFLTNGEDKLLIDFVGKFENLNEDLNRVCQQLNIDSIGLPHLQKSSRKDYRSYYSADLKDKVAARFDRDILIFEYEF